MTDLPYNLPTPRSGKRCLECTPARTTFTPQTLAENSDNPSTDKDTCCLYILAVVKRTLIKMMVFD